MAFESLLGNERIKQNLTAAARKNRFAHFYLISGPKGSGKHTLAKLLAATLMCENDRRPCGECPACRKVMAGTHPDFITVEDPDHKAVPVRIIREARESIFVRPNEGIRKIYLFPQEMGIEGQNALLKVLEEPPSYGVFLILSDNPEKLLPTVRSRCMELQLTAVEPNILRPWLAEKFPEASRQQLDAAIRRSSGYPGQAMELLQCGENLPPEVESFVRAYASRDALALLVLGLFGWQAVEAENFAELVEKNVSQSDGALNGLWIVYALIPVIGMVISTVFYLFYKLNDKDVQIMAKCNSGEISREEAESLLSRKY